MALSSREFLRAAGQRLTTAEFLRGNASFNIDAMYLAGYAMECSLKALILHRTPRAKQGEMFKKITAGGKMHLPEVLAKELAERGCSIPQRLMPHIKQARWSPALRYETGRGDAAETRQFLTGVKEVYDWVKGQLK